MKKSILVVSEKKEVLKQIKKSLSENYEIIMFTNLLDALDMLRESDFDLILLDQNMTWFSFTEAQRKIDTIGKDIAVIGLIDEEKESTLVELRKAKIYNYLLKPVEEKALNRIIYSVLRNLELLKEKRELEIKLAAYQEDNEIIAQSVRMKEVKSQIEKLAETDATILITGEHGVGKEVIAREIHKKSDRRKKKYAVISCGVLPEDIFEREFFGYERGAFEGALNSKKGLIETIEGGTIYIDEISCLSLKLQQKILNVIEYSEFKRGGSTKLHKTNARLLVSSNKDLKIETERGMFKKHLYHRLITNAIKVPALRERKEDISILVNYFLSKTAKELKIKAPVISAEAMKYMLTYIYPGNLRELKNLIERMVILSEDRTLIDVEDLPLELKMKSSRIENKTIVGIGPLKNILEKEIYDLDEVEKIVVAMALQKTKWNKQETSKMLGIGRTTLYEKIRKYDLDTK